LIFQRQVEPKNFVNYFLSRNIPAQLVSLPHRSQPEVAELSGVAHLIRCLHEHVRQLLLTHIRLEQL
jgi:hypothetical protein